MAINQTEHRPMGKSIKRKEDPRFIRGEGRYIDDISLPGMLYMNIVRSPYAHAKIVSIDTTAAMEVPGVHLIITGEDLAKMNLAWMPTLAGDVQMVLATGKVMFQYQEVAVVVAESREVAMDAAQLVAVEYEALPALVDPFRAMQPDAPVLREDREQKNNHIFHWQVGDKDDTEEMFKSAEVVVKQDVRFQRVHPSPLEPCGCIADFNKTTGKLTWYVTSQAPHAHRTVLAMVSGLPEHMIHVISPDIGGGFGNKVPVYPGYVCAIVASLQLGRPVKWIETRTENIASTGFARDYHMTAEIAANKDGIVQALRVKTLADHGAFDAAADPSKFPAGLFNIVTGSYDFKQAFVEVDGVYTNKAPGGVAYRCSFRVTEAAYLIERTMDVLAQKLNIDAADLRFRNFIKKEQFPYPSPLGWTYDSGDYEQTLKLALDKIGYAELRKEQAEKRARGEYMGIGISTFTEIVGAGPSHTFDIMGIKMFDSAEIRVHPTGKAIVRLGVRHQGQGHETTFAQIVAEELGLSAADILVEEGDTDTAPYGLGTYASRSTPTAGGAAALCARRIREKAKKIAAHLLEVSEDDVEWDGSAFNVKGLPGKSVTMDKVALAAYTNLPEGMEPGLEATYYYDPPNLTFPHGAYICVVDIDNGTGAVKVRRFLAVDDCGTVINPMIVEGQIHGGLTEGFGIAFMQDIPYDEDGNCLAPNWMDYLVPTALETPHWETDRTVTPSPHHPIGAKGVGESPNVGSPQAFVNAVVDALSPLGVTHIDMPIYPWKVWEILRKNGVTE
ncbi:aerobic carbon-monoxide dehydrogenase large subunit [Ferviditalea candida]|uniref:Aerobic carbon-monoxide dehydrogenase large subunit n=1 Tax=Ferviditalea candida TaxID=3108399 RepID=A0ABU5ZFX1_9BACL|nr:aerobic carbon-monoxide dehydrogenase large subunit [Paenibacillaceae bacterium T2]